MEYVKLGNSGLEVSKICLGCMSYGLLPGDTIRPWMLPEDESRTMMKAAFDAGINFFDTADIYGSGESERVLGRFVRDFIPRDEMVITTKVWNPWRKGPNGHGLSKKNLVTQLDKSLKNLGVDYIDIYMLHRFDASVPLEETLSHLNDLVRSGKVLYLGASSMFAWQLMKAIGIQRAHGWDQFVVMQNYYNLLYREDEREMMGMCQSEGVAVTPWSPLARGRLARPFVDNANANSLTLRAQSDNFSRIVLTANEDIDRPIIDKINEMAAERGVAPSQLALAWMQTKPFITAPVVGATKMKHLEDALASFNIQLSSEEITTLESLYVPHPQTTAFV